MIAQDTENKPLTGGPPLNSPSTTPLKAHSTEQKWGQEVCRNQKMGKGYKKAIPWIGYSCCH